MRLIDTIPFTNLRYNENAFIPTKNILDMSVSSATVVALLTDPVGNDYYMLMFRDALEEKEIPALQDRNTGGTFAISAMRQLKNGQVLAFLVVPQE